MDSLLYDHLGNFQWTSVTALVSVLVLLAQIIQFFSQKKLVIDMKKDDEYTKLKMKNLGELKSIISSWLYHITDIIIGGNKPLDPMIISKVVLNINRNNRYYQSLNKELTQINMLVKEEYMTKNFDKEEIVKKMKTISAVLNDYELEEIKNLFNTKSILRKKRICEWLNKLHNKRESTKQ